jgi:hypothetical protein
MGWCKYFSQEMRAQFGGSQVVAIGPPGASLDLGFMTPGTLDSRITFTRASTATYTDASGTIQPAAINQPRWDYTGGPLRGLLIEEARTNLLLNSATLGTQGVVVTAQAYTLSFYGTGTITKSGAATGALVGTGATQRVSQTFTPTAGTVTCTVTGSVTNAQLEAGSFATGYIPTTGATATRAQDQCGILAANMTPWFSTVGSWLAEFISINPAPDGNRVLGAAVSAGGGVTQLMIGNNPWPLGQYDGASFFPTTNNVTPNIVQKAAHASSGAGGAAKLCLNGVVTSIPSIANGFASLATSGIRILQTVVGPSVDNGSGYIRRVQFWPRVLSDAEMQQVTT